MTITKQDIMHVHAQHPRWPAPRIARHLGCGVGHVRSVASRYEMRLPRSRRAKVIVPTPLLVETAIGLLRFCAVRDGTVVA